MMDADLTLRTILRAILFPPLGPLLLAGIGFWLLQGLGWMRSARAMIWAGLGGLVLLSMPVVSDQLARAVEVDPPLIGAIPPADAIVVLGAGVRLSGDGPVGASLYPKSLERLAGGARLHRQTNLPLMLSGGRLEEGPAEADLMQITLQQSFGLTARFIENTSRTTHENAQHSAQLLLPRGLNRVVLVTSSVHMRRAEAEFRHAGFVVIPAPVGGVGPYRLSVSMWLPRTNALDRSYDALYEWAGYWVAWINLHH
jgi:uncharacterized SAM-binding protein YcdF (DUF218 family)